jgi:hypothetical protein
MRKDLRCLGVLGRSGLSSSIQPKPRAPQVKTSRAQTHSKVHKIPALRFENLQLTSYAGLVVFQSLFQQLQLKERFRRCFAHLDVQPIFGLHTVMVLLVVHLLLGFRRLRGLDYYRHDPLVARVIGVRRLPDVSTVSRSLAAADAHSVAEVQRFLRSGVTDRLAAERFARLTLDFDGSVQSTTGHAEGTAVGYNKVRKGARSFYPLYCTVSQTGQFLDFLHRPGNVHDSNGASTFMQSCFAAIRTVLPKAVLESRMDAAFFSQEILAQLEADRVDYTCSVPFERFPALKQLIDPSAPWESIDAAWAFFEVNWRPLSWPHARRFLVLRQCKRKQHKGPLQLDLFRPVDYEFEYTVVVTNKTATAKAVLLFHHGRGGQEKIFGEGKQHAALDLIATKRLHANQLFTLAGMMAHNLTREMQMRVQPPVRTTAPKRPAHWNFLQLGTLRQLLLHLAGRLTRPRGQLTLTLPDNPTVRHDVIRYLEALGPHVLARQTAEVGGSIQH